MSEKIEFQTEVSQLLDIVINSLYSEKQIFLRELISNSSDACDKLHYLALSQPEIAKQSGEFKIIITPDEKSKTLKIADNGIGMNKEDLIKNIGTIARSGTSEFVANAKDNGSIVDLIGKFGVGFYSAFMVADKVEIVTKRAGECSAWKWISNGRDGFEIETAEKEINGTEITLYLKNDDKEFADTVYLRQIIKMYSDHINYPIILNLGEYGEETVNKGSALWAKNKSEITSEQYKDFYQYVSKNFDDPWLILHYKAEGSAEYTALLFIPSTQPYDLFQPDKKQGLKLYVNKVFISDKVEELMPFYLRFVKGIVDSSDLPLNISREMLQKSPLIAKIRSATIGRILKELKNRTKDYDDYSKFWNNFGMAFKEGIYEDIANRNEVAELSRFFSTKSEGKLTSLDDYIARADKNKKTIYYITGDDLNTLSENPQLEIFKKNDIEVLLLTDPIDEFWTQTLTTYKDFAIKHISSAANDLKLERSEAKADENNLKKLTSFMEEIFKGEIEKIAITDRLTKSPTSLTVEQGQMSIHLERLMRNHQQQTAFSSSRIFEINPYHPLIIKMSEAINDDANKPQIADISRILLDQAKIAEGETVTDASFFNEKLSEYILKSFN